MLFRSEHYCIAGEQSRPKAKSAPSLSHPRPFPLLPFERGIRGQHRHGRGKAATQGVAGAGARAHEVGGRALHRLLLPRRLRRQPVCIPPSAPHLQIRWISRSLGPSRPNPFFSARFVAMLVDFVCGRGDVCSAFAGIGRFRSHPIAETR